MDLDKSCASSDRQSSLSQNYVYRKATEVEKEE